ncbi:hypothetical protein NHX12_030109 [Muraenolepis orangiensis]|uniref:Interleukin-17 receptor D n=1 Tax=Muraenolepis orangiensis TaxID=630683 RepID=A0A9Q0IMG7_9TELE|nr:hypothetical protein NHX12_030109 [Muraenolepis orangiensis]
MNGECRPLAAAAPPLLRRRSCRSDLREEMATRRVFLHLSAALCLLAALGWTLDPDPCSPQVVSAPDGGLKRLAVSFKTENCSSPPPLGKHVIHEVINVSFSHMTCGDQLTVIVHWKPSPLGIEHVRGFRVYVEEKDPKGKRCQHLVLKDPRQLTFNYKNTKLSSLAFQSLAFDRDYLVRVVPFPTMMNDSFFPPSFLRTNSCELLLGPDNVACKSYWRPRTLNVSQTGRDVHVVFDHAPSSFGFAAYFLYFKLRQEGPFRTQRCSPDYSLPRTSCTLQDVRPGTYTLELRDENNSTRRQTQFYVGQGHSPWAGPVRAMAITVPLVVLSAFATFFTVMCRKKQQENIYSQLDEECSESSNHGAAHGGEREGPRPKVLVVYSNRDGDQHTSVVQAFAYFLQDFCRCEVALDLWEHLQICKEGQMSWLSRQLDRADHAASTVEQVLLAVGDQNEALERELKRFDLFKAEGCDVEAADELFQGLPQLSPAESDTLGSDITLEELTSAGQRDIQELQDSLALYRKAASAKVNWEKSEAVLVGQWSVGNRPSLPGGLGWGNRGVKVLGVWLGSEDMVAQNWEGLLGKLAKLAKWKWLLPQLSYRGRVLVANNLVASSLWHRLQVLTPPPGLMKQLQRLLVDFFWSGHHWVPASVLYLPVAEGGQGLVDITARTAAFRLQAAQRLLYGASPSWLAMARLLLWRAGGFGFDKHLFLLKAPAYEITGLAPFYCSVINAWKILSFTRPPDPRPGMWLFEEPLFDTGFFPGTLFSSATLRNAFVEAGVVKLAHLTGISTEELAEVTGIRSF